MSTGSYCAAHRNLIKTFMSNMSDMIQSIAMMAPGFLIAVVFHEWAHGFMALKFGDTTAKDHDRLTFNPVAHIDPIGTILLPIGLILLTNGMAFGYAKPVPVNPARFSDIKKGIFWVSFAGPLMNIILGFASALLVVLIGLYGAGLGESAGTLIQILHFSIMINFVLAVFNLIPFPPLDGSKMISVFMDYNMARKFEELQRFWLIFLIVLWYFGGGFISKAVYFAANFSLRLFQSILG